MTVNTSKREERYAGDGATTVFPIGFYFLANDEISATLVEDATGDLTTWQLDVDYTLQGAGNQSGGQLTATTAPATGFTLYIRRDMEETQNQKYVENDDLPSATLERGLDRLTMLVQQNAGKIAAALRISVGAPESFDSSVPWVAGSYVKLKADGSGFEPGDGQGPEGPPGDAFTRVSSSDVVSDYLSSKLRIGGKGGSKVNSGANEILELRAPWVRYTVQDPADTAGALDDGQNKQVDCSAGARTITLDQLSSPIVAGTTIAFTKTDLTTNACIIKAGGSDQINGQAEIVLTAPFESVTIQSWGATWIIVARGGPKAVEVQLRAGAWTPRPGSDGSGYPAQINSTPMNYTMAAFDYASSEFACFDWRPPKTFNPAMPIVADIECMVGSSATNLGIAWKLYGESRAYPHILSPSFSQTVGTGGDVNAVNQINQFRFPNLDLSAVHAPGRHVMLVLEGDTDSGVWTMTGDFAYVNALNLTYFEMQQTVVI